MPKEAKTAPVREESPEPVQKEAAAEAKPRVVTECKCNMPLCICEPDPDEEEEEQKKPAPKKAASAAAPAAAAASTSPTAASAPKPAAKPFQSTFSGFGRPAAKVQYDLTGGPVMLADQCREAIKNKDVEGVNTLLGAGCDAKFIDRTGNSLMHLAAMFNSEAIVKLLAAKGANVWEPNHIGETAVDLAPPALAYTMRELQPKPK